MTEQMRNKIDGLAKLQQENHTHSMYLVGRKMNDIEALLAEDFYYEGAEAMSAHYEPMLEKLVEALEKITLKETMCIYGTSDMPSDSDEAFRLGSNLAWVETAELAKEVLAKYEKWRKE